MPSQTPLPSPVLPPSPTAPRPMAGPSSGPVTVAALLLAVTVIAGCSGESRPFEESVEVRQLGLNSLEVVPPEGVLSPLVVNAGERIDFTLAGADASGVAIDVSGEDRSWRVSDSAVASISEDGVFVARADGSVAVDVRIADIPASPFDVTVRTAPLERIVEIREVGREAGDAAEELQPCIARRYAADGRYADGLGEDGEGSLRALPSSLVGWSSTQEDARVDEQDGFDVVFAAPRPGDVQLIASVDGASEPLSLELAVGDTLRGLAIDPTTPAARVGSEQQLIAFGSYGAVGEEETEEGEEEASLERRDITEGVRWSVASGAGLARVSDEAGSRGLVTAEEAGETDIVASCGEVLARTTFTSSAGGTGDDGDGLAFEVDGRDAGDDDEVSVPLGSRIVELRASLGDTYDPEDDVTSQTDFRVLGNDTAIADIREDDDGFGDGDQLELFTGGEVEIEALYRDLRDVLTVRVIGN